MVLRTGAHLKRLNVGVQSPFNPALCPAGYPQAYRAIKSRSLRSGAPANTANGPFVFDGKRESALQQLRVVSADGRWAH